MKNSKTVVLINMFFRKLQGFLINAKDYFFMRSINRELLRLKSVYALLLEEAIVKTRSVFSRSCSKKMTAFVIENAIYVISLRLEPTSNIHLNQ